jgi:hypothetical protein
MEGKRLVERVGNACIRCLRIHSHLRGLQQRGQQGSAMESFFKSLKTERTDGKVYRTRAHAKAEVFDYIERFYNSKRRHSTLSYLSPIEFEQ